MHHHSLKQILARGTGNSPHAPNHMMGRVTLMVLAAVLPAFGNAQETSINTTPTAIKEITLVTTTQANEAKEDSKENQVLRHAVFFSFKDTASQSEIQSVVDAFAALPKKIDTIIDFQAGKNNSPEGLDDGFTHCFLLTFANEAGRSTYLPHPAHTGEFASTLRPHLKKVFVIDYWGTQNDEGPKRELKHAVFFKFKDNADPADVKKVEESFANLPNKIDAIRSFEWGTNNSPENHDANFTHCFMVTFGSESDRKQYLPHPDHLGFVEVLKPVLDKVRVLDFWEDGYKEKK